MKPSVTFVGKRTIDFDVQERQRLAILAEHLDAMEIGIGEELRERTVEGVRIRLLPALPFRALTSAFFYVVAPILALRSHADAIVCKSPLEGAMVLMARPLLSRSGPWPRVVVEVHGDWRSATRHYGSRWRRVWSPLSDASARWSIRQADRVRAIGEYTERLVREARREGPVDSYVTYADLDRFLEAPPAALPEVPRALFVGALDRVKGIDVLLEAWWPVIDSVPAARLVVAGDGPLRAQLEHYVAAQSLSDSVEFVGRITSAEVLSLMDASTCVVVPSRSEGLGRVVLEAMARGRTVVGTAVGGIPELVAQGESGLLVDSGDPGALSSVLSAVLGEPYLAASMGKAGRRTAEQRPPHLRFDEGTRRLAEWVAADDSSAEGLDS